jgi:hypothetical protein
MSKPTTRTTNNLSNTGYCLLGRNDCRDYTAATSHRVIKFRLTPNRFDGDFRVDDSMSDIEKSDVSDRANEQWSLKDGLVAIPILASALALTWEVGYFSRIAGGSFGLFSLAEHITFAIQALPFALTLTTMFVAVVLVKNLGRPRRIVRGFVSLAYGMFAGAAIVSYYVIAGFHPDRALLVLTFVAVLPLFLIMSVSPQSVKSWPFISIIVLCALYWRWGLASKLRERRCRTPNG